MHAYSNIPLPFPSLHSSYIVVVIITSYSYYIHYNIIHIRIYSTPITPTTIPPPSPYVLKQYTTYQTVYISYRIAYRLT